ncbi:hypothetical protein [Ferrimonas marina]|uniref:Curlin associated repeat-containing protein n=1 Tax=Ferrimonas marina TaxID=299255 RepID=A0A1M5VQS6_9GAMM|nr:hypothetical protein [Ferrimonas marina]SHH77344.1 Curlin associated repeat-containing protein [Ferrimonas marina]
MKNSIRITLVAAALASVGFGVQAADSLDIKQVGDKNSVEYRSWGDNDAKMRQEGDNNVIEAGDVKRGENTIDYRQIGDKNKILVGDLDYNSATSTRAGIYKMEQKGDNNRVELNYNEDRDLGPGYEMNFRQDSGNRGDGHTIIAEFHGVYEKADIVQKGNERGGKGNSVNIDSNHGGRNMYNVYQDGEGNSFQYTAMESDANMVDVDQYGERNMASVDLYADNNMIKMRQDGERNNVALSVHVGADGWAEPQAVDFSSRQDGERNSINATFDGNTMGSKADLRQSGDLNVIELVSGATELMAKVQQMGDRNSVDFATQSGPSTGNSIDFYQNGDRNSITGEQKSGGNSMTLRQEGDMNSIHARQTSFGNTANFSQVGNGNSINVAQF